MPTAQMARILPNMAEDLAACSAFYRISSDCMDEMEPGSGKQYDDAGILALQQSAKLQALSIQMNMLQNGQEVNRNEVAKDALATSHEKFEIHNEKMMERMFTCEKLTVLFDAHLDACNSWLENPNALASKWMTEIQAEQPQPEAYPGYTGEYPGFTLKLDERFDRFDAETWAKGDGAVGGEAMCRFTDDGVQINDGFLELVIREEPVPASWSDDHQMQKDSYGYSCGELRTRVEKRVRYGRLEARIKAPPRQQASGYITSLFTYRAEGSPREWEEIDVELEGGRPDKFQANLIYGIDTWEWSGTRQWGAWEDKIVIGPVDEWRVYAIEWMPDRITWFVDGQPVKALHQTDIDCQPECIPPQQNPTPIPDDATDIMMNFWIPNDGIQDVFGGNKHRNVYPMKTQYDWFRYYELDAHPAGSE